MLLNRLKLSFVALIFSCSHLVYGGSMGTIVEIQEPPLYVFFLGATAGMGMYDGTYTATNPVTESHYSKNGGDSFLGGGIAGIESKLDEFYIAMVGNVLFNSLSQKGMVTTNASGVRNHIFAYKNTYQYGGNFRIGANIWGATPYLMGGLETGSWKMQLENNSVLTNHGIPGLRDRQYNEKLVGPQAGIGLLLSLNNLNVGMEFSHTWFGTIHKFLLDPATSLPWHHKNKVEQNQFMLTAAYKFFC